MRKVIVSLIVVLVAGSGGYLGLDYWAQNAVAREVDAMLDGWRDSIGSATRGRIELDLWTRTVKITDVVVQPRSGAHPKMTVAQVIASGIELSGKAARIEIVDLAVSDDLPGQPSSEMEQRAQRVILTDFSVRPVPPRKVATAIDAMQLWLEQFSSIAAARIEIPLLTVSITQAALADAGRQPAPQQTQYTYTNLVLRDVHDGKVAEATTDGIALSGNVGPPFFVLTGEIGKSSVLDADVGPLLAFIDPSHFKGAGGYQRIYRQLSMGPYSLRMGGDDRTGMGLGMTMSLDRLVAEDIGLQPGKVSLDDLTFLTDVTGAAGMGAPGQMPLGQLTMLMDKMAGLYEGVSLGKLDLQGLSVAGMGEQVKLGAIHVEGMLNGRLTELSFDGLEAKPPFGDPVSFERIALKGFDLANFLRLMGLELATPPGQLPSLDKLASMANLLDGFELKGIVVPDPQTGRKGRIDASVTSGDLVGSIPTSVRASFKLSMPLGLPAPEPFNVLATGGLSTLDAEASIGAHWNEPAQALLLEPATLEIAGLMALSVKGSIGKVTPDLFSTDVMKALEALVAVDIGAIEVTLHDLGLVDVAAAEAARAGGQAPEAGRGLLLEQAARNAELQTQRNPAARSFYDAVTQFLQGKGETLTVRLTPRGRVRMLAMLEALRLSQPADALFAAFTVEASSAK